MFDPKAIEDIAKRLGDSLPSSLTGIKDDLEKNFHAILQNVLGALDLVTREEFEVQKAVLAKTRSKLEALEKRLGEIEAQLLPKEP